MRNNKYTLYFYDGNMRYFTIVFVFLLNKKRAKNDDGYTLCF